MNLAMFAMLVLVGALAGFAMERGGYGLQALANYLQLGREHRYEP